jgi:hypothetical protein
VKDVTRTQDEPHDRLTRLCSAMTAALEAHPEHGNERCIIFLQDNERGGLTMHGYEDDSEALAEVFLHLRAIFEANGKQLLFAPLREG